MNEVEKMKKTVVKVLTASMMLFGLFSIHFYPALLKTQEFFIKIQHMVIYVVQAIFTFNLECL